MEGLDDVFFDVQDEVMDDVMSPMRTGGCHLLTMKLLCT